MHERPPDLIPAAPAAAAPTPPVAKSRRGGPRPGGGARPGNLNALKHGRYSRFKDALAPDPFNPAAVARGVLREQRAAAEGLGAAFLRLILDARFKREVARAVDAGRPLPPPPLTGPSRRDYARVRDFLENANDLARLQRAAAAGRIRPNNRAVAEWRTAGDDLEQAFPGVAALIERAARPPLDHDDLASLLGNGQGNGQTALPPVESAVVALAALAESDGAHTPKTSRPNPASRRAALSREARALITALAAAPADERADPHPPPSPRANPRQTPASARRKPSSRGRTTDATPQPASLTVPDAAAPMAAPAPAPEDPPCP